MTSRDQFIAEISRFLGDPYVYGGAGPAVFDCSGLVQYGLRQIGLSGVPRTSEAQWAWVDKIRRADLQPGDLVFSQWPGDGSAPGHVAVYVGNGQMIEAPRPGQSVHQIPLDSGYVRYVTGYGRVPGLTPGTGTGAVPAGFNPLAPLNTLTGWLAGLTSEGNQVLGAIFGPISNVFQDFAGALSVAMTAVLWLVNPMNWVRIFAGIMGTASLITGLILIASAA